MTIRETGSPTPVPGARLTPLPGTSAAQLPAATAVTLNATPSGGKLNIVVIAITAILAIAATVGVMFALQ